MELRIIDDSGNVLPRDGKSSGRLQTRGPAVVQRYFKQDQDCVDEGNWFDTGDIAVIHPDNSLRLTDRAKDVIKSGGEWISSIEIENTAVGCPGVAEAAAIGVPHPKWDERPVVFAVPRPEFKGQVTQEEVIDFLRDKVAKWWLPDEVRFIDEVPKTSVGKFDKKVLRKRLAEEAAPS